MVIQDSYFDTKDVFYNFIIELNQKTPQALKDIEKRLLKLLQKISNNNNATYIGTIQSTEEVNRVSDKIIISEKLNMEKKCMMHLEESGSTRGKPNINNMILRGLYNICYLQDGRECFGWKRPLGSKKQILSALKYECLYLINEYTVTFSRYNFPKELCQ